MFDDCIIMAGGSGTRLWPASSSRRPKQFLPGPGGKSLFRRSLERGLELSGPGGRVIVIAGKGHRDRVIAACAGMSPAERGRIALILEPLARNTAPAIACGTVFAEAGRGERLMLVLPSDHVIEPPEDFRAAAEAAAALAGENLTLFGIAPGRPETGYGYIEAGERLARNAPGPGTYRALSFREKPDRARAEQFLAAGNFYWNSGIFAFSSGLMREEFRRNAPGILRPFEALDPPGEEAWSLCEGLRVLENWPGLGEAYAAAEPVSIDYAVAEKCRRVAMVAGNFRWTDVGSWDEYARLLEAGGAEVYSSGGGNCFVDSEIPVALCGVEDLIVVVRSGKDGSPPAVLIAKKGETQGLRGIVEQIKAAGRTELL
jgi:mannose-1-phosphate guanylyltransferase/mannose-1-phosphate guanylyltransferase/mannose-6-phosphate isomerase